MCLFCFLRVRPWYVSATSSQPRAVTLVVDLSTDGLASSSEILLRAAASDIIKSFSPQDRVGVVLLDAEAVSTRVLISGVRKITKCAWSV